MQMNQNQMQGFNINNNLLGGNINNMPRGTEMNNMAANNGFNLNTGFPVQNQIIQPQNSFNFKQNPINNNINNNNLNPNFNNFNNFQNTSNPQAINNFNLNAAVPNGNNNSFYNLNIPQQQHQQINNLNSGFQQNLPNIQNQFNGVAFPQNQPILNKNFNQSIPSQNFGVSLPNSPTQVNAQQNQLGGAPNISNNQFSIILN